VRVALTLISLTVVGGAERLTLDMYRALKDLDYEVDLYTAYFSERAWEVLTSGMNGIPRPTVLGEPPINRLFSRALLLRELLVASYLVGRLRPYYDLVIETQSNIPLRWADATYIHFPFMYLLKLYLGRQHEFLYEKAYDTLVALATRALVDSTKPVMTNSSWTARYIRGAYGSQRIYVVHPRLT
jgi:hypothetical protein